ncbi:unnamed protein product [Kuraishia capsulata CBS 1993]|uniref:ATP-dependent DNA helicase n=1 Tax=Kuraishia capsulata CBS 1993 TaxID=1382522 RepID=W6MKT1_9ASCO|nr:uncharacterized protein KUCA_T00002626001 [Kuraishia capsulata CBS 1993]CDK26653.1 unnamed protein product [Kuraishia capsulata CBS 1993]
MSEDVFQSLDSFDSFDDDDLLEITPLASNVEQMYEDQERLIVSKKPGRSQMTLDGSVITQEEEEYVYKEISKPITFKNHHNLDLQALKTFVYPTNLEFRDYQFDIVTKSLTQNVLCTLPTGLGKTFIASTVMLNFYRWTTDSKIIFMAPTRPLVAQQVKACFGITGIPRHDTAILLDKVKKNRAEIWAEKRVFFTTPQVVENDLSSGFVDPKKIVCIVVDEAHRAKGNYSYVNVVKFIRRFSNSFRVLALTATPSADVEGVQQIIDNLMISKVAVRTEKSIDIVKYMKRRKVEKIQCDPTPDMVQILELVAEAASPILKKANDAHIYEARDPVKINAFQAMEASQKVIKNPALPEGLKWTYYFLLQLLTTVGQCFRRLNIYGINSFYSYFHEKHDEFTTKYENKKSTNKIAASFYYHHLIKSMVKFCDEVIARDEEEARNGKVLKGVFSHPKFERMVEEILFFFESNPENKNSKIIVFTEFRESALEIVTVLENANTSKERAVMRPHIFIGQSREKEKFDQTKFLNKNKKKKSKKKKMGDASDEEESSLPTSAGSTRSSGRLGSSEDAQQKGMNQKQQKDLIKKFKDGTYNILVATSIGEEGLDIGEVDMIVCFDSTSSPIKNIQRMGRTGRKRDGKVLLLYSSNERVKFEKAMDNYEWIQNKIQKGDGINLVASDRIIPADITPVADQRVINIPDENNELVNEASDVDDDEFLKLATQAPKKATKTAKGNKTSKARVDTSAASKPVKRTKQFFMPDDVETGFQNASALVKRVKLNEEENADTPTHEKSFLDSLVESEGDAPQDSDEDILEFLRKDFFDPIQSPKSEASDVQPEVEVQFESKSEPESEPESANGCLNQSQTKAFKALSSLEDDPEFQSRFEATEGFLTKEQLHEFYQNHYRSSQKGSQPILDPNPCLSEAFAHGQIPHSERTKRFVKTVYAIFNMDSQAALKLKAAAGNLSPSREASCMVDD